MKKRWLLIFVVVFSFCTVIGAEQKEVEQKDKKSLVELFTSYARVYFIEPSWTIPLFLQMSLFEFQDCWKMFSLTIKESPWYVMHTHPSHYSEKKERDLFIEHCKVYDTFLRGLFVLSDQDIVVFSPKKQLQKPYRSIFEYWQKTKNTYHTHFYAFYFDRVAANYIESINNAFLNMDDQKDYHQYLTEAWNNFVTLSSLFRNLEGSIYEARYSDHLKKYSQIRELLIKEKRMREVA